MSQGGIINAADVNQLVTQVNFNSAPPLFVGTQNVTQSLLNTTTTAITFDTNVIDTYNGHSTTTNTSRYVCQQAGYYTVAGAICYAASSTGMRGAHASVNGSALQGCAAQVAGGATYFTTVALPPRDVFLNLNDYVELYGWQSSGGNLSTATASDQASMMWIRYSHS